MDTVTQIEKGQVTNSAAEIYDQFYLPALFKEWAPRVAQMANIRNGDQILDVACGTGVVARHIAQLPHTNLSLTGLDINPGMLAVAAERAPDIRWKTGPAEEIPFEDNLFDVVVSQFGLMFFEDRERGINEMIRVLKPNGTLVVAVWGSLDVTPGYDALVNILDRLFGPEVAMGLRSPYILGDRATFRSLFDQAPLSEIEIVTETGEAKFSSIREWITTDIKGWVISDAVDDKQLEHLIEVAEEELAGFANEHGAVRFAAPGHILRGRKPNVTPS